ncbi:MAG: DUF2441 domain-containing protein [Chlorobiaceae bacterium]|nr:DUF2441 domain-containing protein [Chlorobiaceae bacterium]
MKTFFTVDRTGTLAPEKEISLQHYQDISPSHFQDHVDALYPQGLSFHGERYLLRAGSNSNLSSPAIELLFEYIRRSNFIDSPSRFECFFACESVEDAISFRNEFGNPDQKTYEVQNYGLSHRYNMRLLHNSSSILYRSYAAHQYWLGNQGVPSLGEFWEILLTLPVRISREVK